MNKLTKELIRLGHTNPNLRGHLTPILDVITKTAKLSQEETLEILDEMKRELKRVGLWNNHKWERTNPRYSPSYSCTNHIYLLTIEYNEYAEEFNVRAKDYRGLGRINYHRQDPNLSLLLKELKSEIDSLER